MQDSTLIGLDVHKATISLYVRRVSGAWTPSGF
jgi:hypothetical protein